MISARVAFCPITARRLIESIVNGRTLLLRSNTVDSTDARRAIARCSGRSIACSSPGDGSSSAPTFSNVANSRCTIASSSASSRSPARTASARLGP